MTAREILLVLADNAERRTNAVGTGRYLFVESQSWYLNTTIAAGASRSMIVPVHRLQWIAADGSGRIVSRHGSPYPPLGAGEEIWHDPHDNDRRADDEVFGPGELHLSWPPDSLSSDPEVLRTQLTARQSDVTDVRIMDGVRTLYDEQPVVPEVSAAALRVLAELPGLRCDEAIPEPTGREGVRVSLTSNEGRSSTRHVMVFDGDNGLLIGNEKVLTRSAGNLAILVPCVVSRKIYVRAARTETPGTN